MYKVSDLVRVRSREDVYKTTYINTDVNLVNVRHGGVRSEPTTDIYPLSKQETAEFLIDKMFKTYNYLIIN